MFIFTYFNGYSVKTQSNTGKLCKISARGVDYMQYEERIRDLREDSDLNQTTVARAIHVAQTTYSDYEKGKVRIPLECLIELARFYNVDMNYIAGVSDVKNEFPKK